MGIIAIIQEAFRIGRTHKSLWLFGFFVGFGGNVGTGGGGQESASTTAPPELAFIALLVLIGLACIVGLIILKFVSTGALIEGVKRARGNGSMTVGEGFREGWAHWGVLFRIALLYLAMNATSVAVLMGVTYLSWTLFGQAALFAVGGLAGLIGVPLLVTLYMWQAFAERIAVLENRRALDAIRKARLFLHGRLSLGLKLVVAGLLGVLFLCALALVVIGPVGVLLYSLTDFWGFFPSIAIGVLLLLPVCFVALAMMGIMASSVWTIGYLTQVEQ